MPPARLAHTSTAVILGVAVVAVVTVFARLALSGGGPAAREAPRPAPAAPAAPFGGGFAPPTLRPLRVRPGPAPDDAEVALGRKLFFDVRLSGSNRLSCATCHDPRRRFSDGLPRARGTGLGKRNAPALLNLADRGPYLWDGRAATLEAQALLPIEHPDEMAQDLDALERELAAAPDYPGAFRRAFGEEGVTRAKIARALAAFERTLTSGGSRYDRYLEGDVAALGAEEVRGLELFAGRGECTTCHRGPLLTDNGFHDVGLGGEDRGRFDVAPSARALRAFKTPSLRDVAQTAPYFHDGSRATLEEVVEHYARGGDPKAPPGRDIHPVDLSADERRALVAFLRALDGA